MIRLPWQSCLLVAIFCLHQSLRKVLVKLRHCLRGSTRPKASRLQSLSNSYWLVSARNPFSTDCKCDIYLPNGIQPSMVNSAPGSVDCLPKLAAQLIEFFDNLLHRLLCALGAAVQLLPHHQFPAFLVGRIAASDL